MCSGGDQQAPKNSMKIQRLRNEFDILSSLSHDHIIKVSTRFYESEDGCCAGVQLERAKFDIAQALTPINFDRNPISQIRKWTYGIAQGLAHIHAHNIAHNNIKADNILIMADERAVLADFEFASKIGSETRSRQLERWQIRNPSQMSPELLRAVKAAGTEEGSQS